jgi:hypothetical protein
MSVRAREALAQAIRRTASAQERHVLVAALALRLAELGHAKAVNVTVAGGKEAAEVVLAFLAEMAARADNARNRDRASPTAQRPSCLCRTRSKACVSVRGPAWNAEGTSRSTLVMPKTIASIRQPAGAVTGAALTGKPLLWTWRPWSGTPDKPTSVPRASLGARRCRGWLLGPRESRDAPARVPTCASVYKAMASAMGSQGGAARSGAAKRRGSREHYRRLARLSWSTIWTSLMLAFLAERRPTSQKPRTAKIATQRVRTGL